MCIIYVQVIHIFLLITHKNLFQKTYSFLFYILSDKSGCFCFNLTCHLVSRVRRRWVFLRCCFFKLIFIFDSHFFLHHKQRYHLLLLTKNYCFFSFGGGGLMFSKYIDISGLNHFASVLWFRFPNFSFFFQTYV